MPSDLKPSHLQVSFEPFFLRVFDKLSGTVYLEGRLERGIVPKECLWMLDSGAGEDSCLLLLHKMNLELFQRQDQRTIRTFCSSLILLRLGLAQKNASKPTLIRSVAGLTVEKVVYRMHVMENAPDAKSL